MFFGGFLDLFASIDIVVEFLLDFLLFSCKKILNEYWCC